MPSFILILLAAPGIDGLGRLPRLSAALTAVTAAVVGLIVNLAAQFATHAAQSDQTAPGWAVALLALVALLILLRTRAGVMPVVAGCALAGLLAWTLGPF